MEPAGEPDDGSSLLRGVGVLVCVLFTIAAFWWTASVIAEAIQVFQVAMTVW